MLPRGTAHAQATEGAPEGPKSARERRAAATGKQRPRAPVEPASTADVERRHYRSGRYRPTGATGSPWRYRLSLKAPPRMRGARAAVPKFGHIMAGARGARSHTAPSPPAVLNLGHMMAAMSRAQRRTSKPLLETVSTPLTRIHRL